MEVKIGEFDFADAGQLGGYVVACNHLLRKVGRDNPQSDCLSASKRIILWLNMHLNQAVSPSESPNMNLKSSIPKRLKAQCRLSKR